MDILYSVIAFVVVLGVLVTVHEFGHFWVARMLGIKVLTFSVGFGRALWSRRSGKDETEYVIAMVPLGGYVKMLDESEGNVAEHERHRAFNRQSLSTRVAVVVAGPAFNFLFAILAYWCMYMIGVDGLRPIVAGAAPGSVAERAGLQAGDEMRSVQGETVETWQSAVQAIIASSLDERRLGVEVVDASGRRRERVIDLETIGVDDLTRGRFFDRIGVTPARPVLPAVIGRVESGRPAHRDGLRPGDRVVRARRSDRRGLVGLGAHRARAPGRDARRRGRARRRQAGASADSRRRTGRRRLPVRSDWRWSARAGRRSGRAVSTSPSVTIPGLL